MLRQENEEFDTTLLRGSNRPQKKASRGFATWSPIEVFKFFVEIEAAVS